MIESQLCVNVIFKQDLRWIGAFFLIAASVLAALSVFGLVAPKDRLYPVLCSPFLIFASTAFLGLRKVEIEPEKSLVTESESGWRFWSTSVRKIPFVDCERVVIGGRVNVNRGPSFRKVWLECTEAEPVLLKTIPHGALPEAREAAKKASKALGVEVTETGRKFPGD